MCHEANHRCAGPVQMLQAVSLEVELRRKVQAFVALDIVLGMFNDEPVQPAE